MSYRMKPNHKAKIILPLIVITLLFIGVTQHERLYDWYKGFKVYTPPDGAWIHDINENGLAVFVDVNPESKLFENSLVDLQRYKETKINYPDSNWSHFRITTINNKGHAIGEMSPMQSKWAFRKSYYWNQASFTELKVAKNGASVELSDINDSNQIVGYYYFFKPANSTTFGTPITESRRAFYWSEKEGRIDLHEKLNSQESLCHSINNHGAIAGSVHNGAKWIPFYLENDNLTLIEIENMSLTGLQISALNDRGEILIEAADQTRPRASLIIEKPPIFGIWSKPKGFKPIKGTKKIKVTWANGLDNQGRVLVQGEVDNRKEYYLYKDGHYTSLSHLSFKSPLKVLHLKNNNWIIGVTEGKDELNPQWLAIKLLR